MAVEQLEENLWQLSPGPMDPHTHPRVFDVITEDNFVPVHNGQEGRAGLRNYTEVALRSGIVAMIAMPNEILRRLNIGVEQKTEEVPYPIANLDRVLAMQAAISHEAYIPVGINFGLEPNRVYGDTDRKELDTHTMEEDFSKVQKECMGLKIFADPSTGGNNIAVEHVAQVIYLWNQYNPEKPVTIHAEGENVQKVLESINDLDNGSEIPIHIAHVSSRQELQAVIDAKEAGMNVTCEATPHHLFFEDWLVGVLGGGACMKPSLKTAQDREFLWKNIKHIDMLASDCAPHRKVDKEADNPAFGVTNHTIMLPLFLGAVADGKLSMQDLYEKMCVNPRKRFNLPLEDQSEVLVSTADDDLLLRFYENNAKVKYGQNPFVDPRVERLHYVGRVIYAKAGKSLVTTARDDLRTSYTHLITPKNHSTYQERE